MKTTDLTPTMPKISQSRIRKPTADRKTPKSTFGKAKRFKNLEIDAKIFIDLPSTLSGRSCSFGLGKRWTPSNCTGKDSPSPQLYNLPNCFGTESRGVLFKNLSSRKLKILNKNPGPGTYNPYSPLGKNSPQFTFKKKFPNKLRTSTPPPDAYQPNFRLQECEKFKYISFGRGKKTQIMPKTSDSPGPGTYEIASVFLKHSQRTSSTRSITPVIAKAKVN